jgi:hypothetical protein
MREFWHGTGLRDRAWRLLLVRGAGGAYDDSLAAGFRSHSAVSRRDRELRSRAGEIAEFRAEAAIDATISDWRKHTGA